MNPLKKGSVHESLKNFSIGQNDHFFSHYPIYPVRDLSLNGANTGFNAPREPSRLEGRSSSNGVYL